MKNNQHRLFTKINLNTLAKEDAASIASSSNPAAATSTASMILSGSIANPSTAANNNNNNNITIIEEIESPSQSDDLEMHLRKTQVTGENQTGAIDSSSSSSSNDSPPPSMWFIGKVLLKEFCIAKKVRTIRSRTPRLMTHLFFLN